MEIFQGDFFENTMSCPLDVLTVGKFDGVHRGHQELLKWGQKQVSVGGHFGVLTFSPQPWEFFNRQDRSPILSFEEQVELLESYGVTHLFIQKFDQRIAELTPGAFCKNVLGGLVQPKAIVVGHDFSFGYEGAGRGEDFAQFISPPPIVKVMEPLLISGVRVSSTMIRNHLSEGDIQLVEAFLGRRYQTSHKIIRGNGLGRTIGFPTANFESKSNLQPGAGVYCVSVEIESESSGPLLGVLNCGVRPTMVSEGDISMEVHLPGYSGDLYGQTVRVHWLKKIRDEVKFESKEDLVDQIQKDIELSIKLFED